MRGYGYRGLVAVAAIGLAAPVVRAQLVLNDPLQGSTTGIRSGGQFVTGGWKVTNTNDYIIWHVPTLTTGAVEFDVKGLNANECRPDHEDKSELFHMYDYTIGGSDTNYNGGYRDNPYKHFIRKTNCLDPPRVNSMELVWKINDNYEEPDTAQVGWDPNLTYHFREEWEPIGGNTVCRMYRDNGPGTQLVLLRTMIQPGSWNPAGHSIRIAASPRAPIASDFGAPLDAIFSNVKVYSSVASVPGAPTITTPTSGQTVNTNLVYVAWTGDAHTQYEVQINTSNQADTSVVWTSGPVTSSRDFAWTGMLSSNATYYAFVRLANGAQFGPWSAGRAFTVDTSYVPPGPDLVRLQGNTVVDKSGPLLGLGATYMQAMRRCKYDRTRFESDLTFLASKEFKYVRILSMVGWYEAWAGKEIAPVSFTNRVGTFVPAWTDYWQQFRDCIDLIYNHGMRAEITIFADAQLMPSKSARIAHMQSVLDNLAGREHKVMHLEVANEAWQNGFPDAQGVADLREFCTYLTDRTSLLVAISDSQGSGSATELLYAGSTADIATEHFSRDIGTIEGGWLPVRDPWEFEFLQGVPPGSSNEPIGPGASVNSENDPIKLVMAAAFAWGAYLPMYVFHSDAGVFGNTTFESKPGVGDYVHLNEILPPDLASWVRYDGKETGSPFTTYSNGQPNKWWPEISSSASGVVRNTAAIKGGEFLTFPIGVQSTGVLLEARRPMQFNVYHPLTGAVAASYTLSTGQQVTLPQGPRGYIIRGVFTDVVNPSNDVCIDLGNPDVLSGLTHPQVGDGDTIPTSVGGRTARRNLNPAEDFYFYFGASDAWAFQGSKPDVYVTMEYYDGGTGTLTLQYDAVGADFAFFYKNGGGVALTGTDTWKTYTWHVTDAYFGNRQNGGADFRVGSVGNTFYIDTVCVSTQAPTPPVIHAVTPNPDPILNGTAYSRQLALAQGHPAPTWSVLQGPAGLGVSPAGLVSGWTPGAGVFGLVPVQVQAANAAGSDIAGWNILVLSRTDFDMDGDTDLVDFALMQRCFSGEAELYAPGCEGPDLDGDLDVDSSDFNAMVGCMRGSNQNSGC